MNAWALGLVSPRALLFSGGAMLKYEYRCQECGSTEVQIRIWINPNKPLRICEKPSNCELIVSDSDTQIYKSLGDCDEGCGDCWCENCEEDSKLDIVKIDTATELEVKDEGKDLRN